MYRIRADRLGSLCACKSVDPGSRGAMHARVAVTLLKRVTEPIGFCVRDGECWRMTRKPHHP